MATLYTVGHGARSAGGLIAILRQAGIETLVDVRAFPASRRNPQFALRAAGRRAAGCRYSLRMAGQGARRLSQSAESSPEACHRSHIADWLVARGHRVVHLPTPGRAREHLMHPQEELWRED